MGLSRPSLLQTSDRCPDGCFCFVCCYFFILGFWVHCNDSKLNMCTMEEVCKAQAYILFYSQRLSQANGLGKICPSTSESQQHTELADCSVDNSSS